jgi:ESS family glutamate:Na+ symporter
VLLKHLVIMLVAVGAGQWVSAAIAALGWTLPTYIGAMIVAAVIGAVVFALAWGAPSHGYGKLAAA